jgi:hypothetical protein
MSSSSSFRSPYFKATANPLYVKNRDNKVSLMKKTAITTVENRGNNTFNLDDELKMMAAQTAKTNSFLNSIPPTSQKTFGYRQRIISEDMKTSSTLNHPKTF